MMMLLVIVMVVVVAEGCLVRNCYTLRGVYGVGSSCTEVSTIVLMKVVLEEDVASVVIKMLNT